MSCHHNLVIRAPDIFYPRPMSKKSPEIISNIVTVVVNSPCVRNISANPYRCISGGRHCGRRDRSFVCFGRPPICLPISPRALLFAPGACPTAQRSLAHQGRRRQLLPRSLQCRTSCLSALGWPIGHLSDRQRLSPRFGAAYPSSATSTSILIEHDDHSHDPFRIVAATMTSVSFGAVGGGCRTVAVGIAASGQRCAKWMH